MNTIVMQIQTNARNDFPVRLMDTLIDKEYTQLRLSEEIGVDKKRENDWVHGKCFPDLWNFIAICAVLGVSADYLLFGKDKVNDEI